MPQPRGRKVNPKKESGKCLLFLSSPNKEKFLHTRLLTLFVFHHLFFEHDAGLCLWGAYTQGGPRPPRRHSTASERTRQTTTPLRQHTMSRRRRGRVARLGPSMRQGPNAVISSTTM